MANNPSTLPGYNGQTAAPDANYPFGSARNDAAPGDLTGTPRIAAEINDIMGFQQALLNAASIVPSGSPDTVLVSQYLQALKIVAKKINGPLNPATLEDWQNDPSAQLDDVVTTVEYFSGTGGGGTGDVIASGTETGFGIVKHNTLPLSWELRVKDGVARIKQFGAKGDGINDDTGAVQAALDRVPFIIPDPGIYMISRIVPNDDNTIATSALAHTNAAGITSTIFRYITGSLVAGQAVIDCLGKNRVNLMGFMLDGVDRTEGIYGLEPTDNSMFIFSVHIKEFERGVSSGINYISSSEVIGLKMSNCGTGIRGARDTRFTNCHSIGCDDFGWNMGTGSNDNQWSNCKADFNGVNFNLFDGSNNIINGIVIDRADTVGMRISGGTGNKISNITFRRNGSSGNVSGEFNCHLKIEGGATDITVTGVTTRTGADDGGGGNTTPLNSVFLGTCSDVTFVNNHLEGSTGDTLDTAGTQTNVRFTACTPLDINDVIAIKGTNFAKELLTSTVANSGGVVAVPFVDIPVATFNRRGHTIRVSGRTTTGANFQGTIPFMLRRESGSVTAVIGNIVNEILTLIGSTILVDVINVATDGSSYDIEITNNESNDIKCSVNIF